MRSAAAGRMTAKISKQKEKQKRRHHPSEAPQCISSKESSFTVKGNFQYFPSEARKSRNSTLYAGLQRQRINHINNMSEWGEGLIRNKSSLVLWGTVTVIAILRYIYEARCAPQRFQEGPLDEEEAEAQIRNSAAEGRLLNKLEEATGVRFLMSMLGCSVGKIPDSSSSSYSHSSRSHINQYTRSRT